MTQQEDIKNAVECMRKGGVILYPTDTVWGIGCDATNAEAVAKVYKIKQRDDSKALICLVDSADRMARYFRNVPQVAWDFIDAAMPVKPTTVILDDATGIANNLVAEDGSLSARNSAIDSRSQWSAPVPTSVASQPPRTTATSTLSCWRWSIMSAGLVARSTSHTSHPVLSSSLRMER